MRGGLGGSYDEGCQSDEGLQSNGAVHWTCPLNGSGLTLSSRRPANEITTSVISLYIPIPRVEGLDITLSGQGLLALCASMVLVWGSCLGSGFGDEALSASLGSAGDLLVQPHWASSTYTAWAASSCRGLTDPAS